MKKKDNKMNPHNQQIQEYLNRIYGGKEIMEDIDKFVLECPYGDGKRISRDGDFIVELDYCPVPNDTEDSKRFLVIGITFNAGRVLSDIRIFTKISDRNIRCLSLLE